MRAIYSLFHSYKCSVYRLEAKLALPVRSKVPSATANSIVSYGLFDNNDMFHLSSMKRFSGMCFFSEAPNALYSVQPILMVGENKPEVVKKPMLIEEVGRTPGEAQLTMAATCALHHRHALNFDDEKATNVVYGLLQEGELLQLYVAYMERDDKKDPLEQEIVCFPTFIVLLELTLMQVHA